MAESEPLILYRIVYSDAVEQRLRGLSEVAIKRGDGPAFVAALKALHARLAVYPQFGEPLYDLTTERGQIYTGIIPPIAIRYGVLEDRRLVFCGALPVLRPMARHDDSGEE